ncbi:Retrovirus-related Pol polyprotein from transposon opus, partial [Mucuna pruriens]
MAIFSNLIEEYIKIFMDDFFVFGPSFVKCLYNLNLVLKRCRDTNLVLNLEKCQFMVQVCIVLGHKVSVKGIEVDPTKVKVIAKLPLPITVKVLRSFLSHARDYKRPKEGQGVLDHLLCQLYLERGTMELHHHKKGTISVKPCLIRWILLLQEFDLEIKNRKGIENHVAN